MGTSRITPDERVLNLVICLLHAPQFVTAEYIRKNVTGYASSASGTSFKRMLERDKMNLRENGIPVVTGLTPEGEEGYRIDPATYSLPEITLDVQEAAAVAMAVAFWKVPEVAALSRTAMLKLEAAGIDLPDDVFADIETTAGRTADAEPVLAALVRAIDTGRAVTFEYRAGSTAAPTSRTLEPWGVVTHRGHWYVVGHDRTRKATRTFRLSRLSDVEPIGKDGSVAIPEGVDLQRTVADTVDSAIGTTELVARVWVAADRAHGVRRMARSTTPHRLGDADGDLLEIGVRYETSAVRAILGAGADVVVLEPAHFRATVIDALDNLIEVTRASAATGDHHTSAATGDHHTSAATGDHHTSAATQELGRTTVR
ncbi:WYL domain-containing protein [Gordonia pseudamarae]|uniref:WYL domain-containing protein n=1 Tax=Gordonia pseudamarae TaxID=2831662 RepID=A0ABX6IHH6_9ACTN|nr:WYL domain-containing protein [Gordonia pseudamarae]QHN26423.1 WYL domain-containing protein [Gordonia pseudamarae]QHN35318.1 WYL domain-containing protein [Gordonia pseudamarae]